jgi:hypothetical protein
MFDMGLHQDDDILAIKTRHLSSAQAKWERLTHADYSRIGTIAELIAAVRCRYSLSLADARRDVEIWTYGLRL